MLIVANWKAYVSDTPAAKKLLAVSKKLSREGKNRIVLAPPAPLLGLLADKNRSKVGFAGQDVSTTTSGAQTGEVTAAALFAAGARFVIVGHSERRARGETSIEIGEKLVRACAEGLTPILCIGESERDSEGRYLATVREELTAALSALPPKERSSVIVAYEPLWAIGKSVDNAIMPDDLVEMVLYIRKVLAELLLGKSSSKSLVLYGGSVEEGNIRGLAASTHIDGFLIGRASVDPKSFSALVKNLR